MSASPRLFLPAISIGLGGSILVALAGSKPWTAVPRAAGMPVMGTEELLKQPLAGSLGVLLVATWGVIVISGPTTRRVGALISLVIAVGVVATVVDGYSLPTRVGTAFEGQAPTRTAWIWVTLLGGVLVMAAAAMAFRFAASWPRMSSRYDSPVSSSAGAQPNQSDPISQSRDSQRELWDQLNQGVDPTTQLSPEPEG